MQPTYARVRAPQSLSHLHGTLNWQTWQPTIRTTLGLNPQTSCAQVANPQNTPRRDSCGIDVGPRFLCLQGERQFNDQTAFRCVDSSHSASVHPNNSLRDR